MSWLTTHSAIKSGMCNPILQRLWPQMTSAVQEAPVSRMLSLHICTMTKLLWDMYEIWMCCFLCGHYTSFIMWHCCIWESLWVRDKKISRKTFQQVKVLRSKFFFLKKCLKNAFGAPLNDHRKEVCIHLHAHKNRHTLCSRDCHCSIHTHFDKLIEYLERGVRVGPLLLVDCTAHFYKIVCIAYANTTQ